MTSINAMMTADYGLTGDILRLRAADNPDHPAIMERPGDWPNCAWWKPCRAATSARC